MKVLVLGGTRFFGKALVRLLVEKGYDVTIATRGLTADEFGEDVKRLKINREDRESMENAFRDQSFDLVFDTICYSSSDAAITCSVLKGKADRYVFVSSMAVYEQGFDLEEGQFDPTTYDIKMGKKDIFTYAEGKRQAEAVFYQQADFPVVSVRFPVVLGTDDYTERLYFYCKKVYGKEAMQADEGEFSFIEGNEAGRFLAWVGEESFTGPINASSNGTISMKDILLFLAKLTGNEAVLKPSGYQAPYNNYTNYTLNNGLARELGFRFNDVHTYILPLIEHYIEKLRQV